MNMYNIALIVPAIACIGLFSSCKHESTETETMAEEVSEIITDTSGQYAKVNNEVITNDEFNNYAAAKRASQPDVTFADETILDELVTTELLRQEAIKDGINKRPEIMEQIERQETNLLINTLMTEKFGNTTFTDEEVKAEYDRLVRTADTNEFKARHILVQTEEEAKAIVAELNEGADFVEVAKNKSQGPSAPNGGDLGWFRASSMVPPFAEAVSNMEKGKISEPVKTRFGWHVILLEDKRSQEQPTLEDMQQEINRNLTRLKVGEYIQELMSQSTIVRPEDAAADTGS